MVWIVIGVVAAIAIVAAILLLKRRGTIYLAHAGGFMAFSSETSSEYRIVARDDIPRIVEAVVAGHVIDGIGITDREDDKPEYGLGLWDDELRVDGSFRTAAPPEPEAAFRALMAELDYVPNEDYVWNEGMGPELECRTISYLLPREAQAAYAVCAAIIDGLLEPSASILVSAFHSDDGPGGSRGIKWRAHRDRLGEVLATGPR